MATSEGCADSQLDAASLDEATAQVESALYFVAAKQYNTTSQDEEALPCGCVI